MGDPAEDPPRRAARRTAPGREPSAQFGDQGARRDEAAGLRWCDIDFAGHPDTGEWLAGVPATVTPGGQRYCLVGFCGLWAELGIPFCQGHGATWKVHGRPEPGGFAARYLDDDPVPGHERIFVDSLPPQLKLEIQYELQRRCDERAGKAPPFIVMIVGKRRAEPAWRRR